MLHPRPSALLTAIEHLF